MTPLAAALQILDGAEPRGERRDRRAGELWQDRIAALALAEEQAGMAAGMASSSMSVAEEAVARFLARRSHLILRGGPRALLREALSEPAGTPVARMAEALRREGSAAAGGAAVPVVRAVRRGGTRPHDDGRVRTLESGARQVGQVAFSADGEYVCAFTWGATEWSGGDGGSTFVQWRVATGERVAEGPAGQFREDNGSFALSPDMRLLAARDHRDIAVYDLAHWEDRAAHRPHKLHELRGSEGPYAITFLDEEHLVADDSSLEVAVWNAVSRTKVASAPAIGWRDHAVARRASRLLVTGGLKLAGRTVGVHALPSLELLGTFRYGGEGVGDGAAQPARGERIAVSPEERWVATGDDAGGIFLWAMRDLEDPERQSSPRTPLPVAAHFVGRHRSEVSALRFIDERRLLSGSWDRSVLCWDLEALPASSSETPIAPVRRLLGHLGWITSIDVHPERHLAASSSEDGRVILWDLRGASEAPPSPLPPARKERTMRPHPDGVEVISDGVSTVIARPPGAGAAPEASPLPQDPELIGINLEGFLVIPVDDPGPPQLLLYPASAPLVALPDGEGHKPSGDPVDVIELELHSGGLCALGPRSFAVGDGDGHVSFWELLP